MIGLTQQRRAQATRVRAHPHLRLAVLAERRFGVWTEPPTLRLAPEAWQSEPGQVHAEAQALAQARATGQLWQVRQQPARSRRLL